MTDRQTKPLSILRDELQAAYARIERTHAVIDTLLGSATIEDELLAKCSILVIRDTLGFDGMPLKGEHPCGKTPM